MPRSYSTPNENDDETTESPTVEEELTEFIDTLDIGTLRNSFFELMTASIEDDPNTQS